MPGRPAAPPAPVAPSVLAPLAALALGALHAFAFAPRDAWWLQTACVTALVLLLARAGTVRQGAALGFAFSLGWLCAGVWWLFISLHRYGGLPAWMAVLAIIALCAFLSIYMAAAAAAWVAWRPPNAPLRAALLLAALWLLAELARGIIFTGFPWLAAGYAHVDGPLGGLAPWLGVYGIGAWSTLAAALLALTVVGAASAAAPAASAASARPAAAAAAPAAVWRLVSAVLAVALLWLPVLLVNDFSRTSGPLSVALIQGNVPQNEKFETSLQPETLAWTTRALIDAKAELVIAPETAIPLLPEQLPEGFWSQLGDALSAPGRAALVGVPLTRERPDGSVGYTNSAVGFSAAALQQPPGFFRYDKHHLVPFGEFIPPGFRWFTTLMNMPLGDFDRGPLVAPSFNVARADGGVERIGPNICYEDLFGEQLAARYGPDGDAPTILANISNIAWFGESEAIDQHLQISRLRTLELQRPMIRATNTGATVVIDHRAKVTRWLAPHTRGVLEGTVEGREGVTPFAWWAGRFGQWPLVGLALAVVAAVALTARRNGRT